VAFCSSLFSSGYRGSAAHRDQPSRSIVRSFGIECADAAHNFGYRGVFRVVPFISGGSPLRRPAVACAASGETLRNNQLVGKFQRLKPATDMEAVMKINTVTPGTISLNIVSSGAFALMLLLAAPPAVAQQAGSAAASTTGDPAAASARTGLNAKSGGTTSASPSGSGTSTSGGSDANDDGGRDKAPTSGMRNSDQKSGK
jgi:hypothetical protein